MIPRLTVHRRFQCHFGMFSQWSLNLIRCWGVERRKDDPAHPAVLAGLYTAKLGMMYSGDGPGGKADYPAYILQNVPGNPPFHPDPYTEVKVHIANFAAQLEACLAPGLILDWVDDAHGSGLVGMGVSSSHFAFAEMMKTLDGAPELEILITEEPGL